jgi:hypothetical protein
MITGLNKNDHPKKAGINSPPFLMMTTESAQRSE